MYKYLKEIQSYDSSNGLKQLNITSIIRNMIVECRQAYTYNNLKKKKVIDFISDNLDEIVHKLTPEEIRSFCMMYLKNEEFSKSPRNLMRLYTQINKRIEEEIIAGNKMNGKMCEAVELLLKKIPEVCQVPDWFENNYHNLFSTTTKSAKICAYKILRGKDKKFDNEVIDEIHKNLKAYLDNQNAEALLNSIEILTNDSLFRENEDSFVEDFEIMQTSVMREKNPENMEKTIETCKCLDNYFDSYTEKYERDIPKIKDLIDKSMPPLVFMLIDKYKNIQSTELRSFMNDRLEDFKSCHALWLLQKSKYCNSVFDHEEYNEGYIVQNYEVVRIMLDELLQSENQRLIDITQVEQGGFSTVYQIKDKIIKIGKKRINSRIPMHRRLIQPLVRLDLDDSCIEVQNKAEISYDLDWWTKLYPIFCEMLDEGIIWGDPKSENVGVLLEDNVVTLNGNIIQVSPESINYDVREDFNMPDPLKAGELAIIDTDYVFYESERNFGQNFMTYLAKEFYKLYKAQHPDRYDKNGKRKPNTIIRNVTKDDKNCTDEDALSKKTNTNIENR